MSQEMYEAFIDAYMKSRKCSRDEAVDAVNKWFEGEKEMMND